MPSAQKKEMMQQELAFTRECNVTYYTNRSIYALAAERLFITVQEPKMNWELWEMLSVYERGTEEKWSFAILSAK